MYIYLYSFPIPICLSASYAHVPEMILPLETFDAVMLRYFTN